MWYLDPLHHLLRLHCRACLRRKASGARLRGAVSAAGFRGCHCGPRGEPAALQEARFQSPCKRGCWGFSSFAGALRPHVASRSSEASRPDRSVRRPPNYFCGHSTARLALLTPQHVEGNRACIAHRGPHVSSTAPSRMAAGHSISCMFSPLVDLLCVAIGRVRWNHPKSACACRRSPGSCGMTPSVSTVATRKCCRGSFTRQTQRRLPHAPCPSPSPPGRPESGASA